MFIPKPFPRSQEEWDTILAAFKKRFGKAPQSVGCHPNRLSDLKKLCTLKITTHNGGILSWEVWLEMPEKT